MLEEGKIMMYLMTIIYFGNNTIAIVMLNVDQMLNGYIM